MANKCSELSPWNYRMDYESKRVHQQHKISNENRFCQPFPNNMFIVLNCSPCRHALSSIRYYYFETKTIFTHTHAKCAILFKQKEGRKVSLYLKINQISFIWVNETPHSLVQFWIVFVQFKIFITVNNGNMFNWIS